MIGGIDGAGLGQQCVEPESPDRAVELCDAVCYLDSEVLLFEPLYELRDRSWLAMKKNDTPLSAVLLLQNSLLSKSLIQYCLPKKGRATKITASPNTH
jgi:hypothetical protein